jgi:RimJ/RimL family protein N-acetyltransferase
MRAFDFDNLAQHADVLRLRDGQSLTVRFVELDDADALQRYVRSLSGPSRYNRFLGALSELPRSELEKATHIGGDDRFSVIATMRDGDAETVVAEARYAFLQDDRRVEIGLSVDDRWQGHGIGRTLLANLECRAAVLGAESIYGDTLRSNGAMIGLARKAGYSLTPTPRDWRLVRFEKPLDRAAADIPCASWRLAARATFRRTLACVSR